MKKLSPIAYRSLFFKHVTRFLENITTPRERQGGHLIGVSGGIDSMTLLWVAHQLSKENLIGPVRAVFVHHHTRAGQDQDRDLVKKFCEEEGIPVTLLDAQGLGGSLANFEARARNTRRELCLKETKKGELLWSGHHLDDSFEWNLMQRHRSTNPRSTIGIPVRNRQIVRPFLCVSKVQIKRLARFEGIPYREDPTNEDTRYDRNYVRNSIVPLIKKRYPKCLKFYSHFANFSAMMLKVNLIGERRASNLFVFESGALVLGRQFSELQIQELIHNYSNADRGEIITPIERMLRAIDNGKKGPFHFSGGMEAYYSYGLLMVYRQGMKNYDEEIAKGLAQFSKNSLQMMSEYTRKELEQAWQNLISSHDAMMNMPGLVLVLESDSICKTLNTSVFDPLFPLTSKVCQEKGLRFMTFRKCLEIWDQKSGKLPKKLKLLPLNNLSNLFTSQ